MPLVSILTTIYNREKYIRECIESILASSFQDWELIVVDDCSTDSSVVIAREFEKKDLRIKVYVNESNLGDYPNRNKAATFATGKYLKYLDADDTIYNYSLQIMVDAMEQFPDADLALSHNVINPLKPYPQLITSHDALLSIFLGKSVLGVGPSAAIIRRSAFEELGGFSGKQYIGDTELWIELASKRPVVILQPSLVYWRQHEGQQIVSEKKNYEVLKKRHVHKIDVLKSLRNRFSADEFIESYRFTEFRYARLLWNYLVFRRNLRTFFQLYKGSGLSFISFLKALVLTRKN